MKSMIGIRISNVDIASNGPAVLRRVLMEYCKLIEEGAAALTIPEKITMGDITFEMSAGPMDAFTSKESGS
jgi:hypothetical protein